MSFGDEQRPTAPARLTVLSGPSGVGKDSVIDFVRTQPHRFWLSVSVTTRPQRDYEAHGEHYFFATDAEFDQLVADGALLEWAEFAGNRYGTPRAEVERRLTAGTPVLLKIDIQGARQVRQQMPEAQLVFLAPPSREELERRLRGRGTETYEVIAHRLELARDELAAQAEFDLTIVNDSVDRAAHELIHLLEGQPADPPRVPVPHHC